MKPSKKIGRDTIELSSRPRVCSWASAVGRKESEGKLAGKFDIVYEDDLLGEKTFELAEARMLHKTVLHLLDKAKIAKEEVDVLLGGDLINQIMATNFAGRELDIPLLGLFSACSTFTEALSIAALLIDGGGIARAICASSSHFSSAERQYRLPLEQGGQRAPSAQWTVTGCGAVLLCDKLRAPSPTAVVTHTTIGRVVDYGVNDSAHMGAAMAPAAAGTLEAHFNDTGRKPSDYDVIVTGDLGAIGSEILKELMSSRGYKCDSHMDCGASIYNDDEFVNAGGSGAGCCASVFAAEVLPRFERREIKRALFVATGALLNSSSVLQGESIPAIAHCVALEASEI